MLLLKVFITLLLSVFATIVMSYIALAASIGPWIETTLVLVSMFLFRIFTKKITSQAYVGAVGLTTVAGAVGGILATGLAFSFPTLYFLAPKLFNSWLQRPFFFAAVISSFSFVAGSFGILIATFFEDYFLNKQKMKFPIGELVYNTIASPGHIKNAIELTIGFFCTQLFLFLYSVSSFAQKSLLLLKATQWSLFSIPALTLPIDQFPLYLAVGFVTGHVISLPLVVGFLAKIALLDPLFYLYTHTDSYIHALLFSHFANIKLSSQEFVLAFCSGIVLFGSLQGFLELFKAIPHYGVVIWRHIFRPIKSISLLTGIALLQISAAIIVTILFLCFYTFTIGQQLILSGLVFFCVYALIVLTTNIGTVTSWGYFPLVRLLSFREIGVQLYTALSRLNVAQSTVSLLPVVTVCASLVTFFCYFKFSALEQFYIYIGSALCIYQMLFIAGKIGIIPLGRFATFVMVPGLLLFNFDPIKITFVAAFVEIAGGVAGDILFGRRLACLAKIEHKQIVRYQWLGLIVSSLVIGGIFWLFITSLGLGPESGLPATKAASRALLVSFKNFDWYVLIFGFVFGYLIKYTKINPALLLGGILMPPSISLMLIIGGSLTYLTQNKERFYPLLSGVSAGNSLWMLGEILFRLMRC